MSYIYVVFLKDNGGYGYSIINTSGNAIECEQIYKPGTSGYLEMTETIASSIASTIVDLKNNPPPALFTIAVTPQPTQADKLSVKNYIESLGYTIKVLS